MYGSYYVELFAVQGSEQYYQTPGYEKMLKMFFFYPPNTWVPAKGEGEGIENNYPSLDFKIQLLTFFFFF